jgi:acyl carrier protein
MFVDAIPLTATGKVDRSALPPPTLGRQDVASTFEAPRTECEASIAAAWQEALGVGAIGVHDHFLDLGGDSLQAMQISVLLTARFGVPIHAVLMLSECATVADLAAHIVAATPPGGAAVV